MTKGKFGGEGYKPRVVGPDPAEAPPPVKRNAPESALDAATLSALKGIKVPFSSRITAAADRQLKSLAREGHSQTALLSEALNLLFKRHGRDEVA